MNVLTQSTSLLPQPLPSLLRRYFKLLLRRAAPLTGWNAAGSHVGEYADYCVFGRGPR